MPSNWTIYLIVTPFLALLINRLFFEGFRRRGFPLPPGPAALPWIGRDIMKPGALRCITYHDMSKLYGEVFQFIVFGHRTIVLNSRKAIVDLLEKRSYNYSDRPDQPMILDLMDGNWSLPAMRYSDRWRLHRRTFHQQFQPRVMSEYYDIQKFATLALVNKLSTSPEQFFDHVRYQSSDIVLKIVYGYIMKSDNDPYIQLVHNAMEGAIEGGRFGSFWVDYFPLLKYIPSWFPGAGFKRKAKKWRSFLEEVKERPWEWVKEAADDGTAIPSFSTRSSDRLSVTFGENSMMEEVIKNCAAVAYSAGTDTVASSILTFILAMVLHPEIQTRAQKELDTVVGSSRLPDFDDRERLPFLNAILLETLRWRPVTPLALSHRAVSDDVYEGYFIPAGELTIDIQRVFGLFVLISQLGTTIVANTWAVLYDETLYGSNVMDFDPNRFLQEGEGKPPSPDTFAFGYGRRICPGRYLALNTLYITMAQLLTSFTMVKALDEEGREITPKGEYVDGLLRFVGLSILNRVGN